jgi:hypothetical protein
MGEFYNSITYQKLTGFGWPGFDKMNLWQQDKGHKACAKAFYQRNF